MSAIVYDTTKAVEHYREAGFDEVQARALAEENAQILGERIVARDDLQHAVESIRKDIEGLQKDMTISIGVVMAAGISLNIAITALIISR
ncbi:MAG: hypothetical protein F4213_18710 [Boseongicola sp. SB0677_bin_26]|nr:hypothetical protein [Boseongicola sp. SB0665_bin_10]MYG28022.1 hypothetical protein [Boseongicola sp. SB0677_bin_26]